MPTAEYTTAIQLITRAMRICRAIGKGEVPDADEARDGLMALNAMMDNWAVQRLLVYRIDEWAVSLLAGIYEYDVPTLYETVDETPVWWVRGCNIDVDGVRRPVQPIGPVQWGQLSDRSKTGPAQFFWWRTTPYVPKIYVYPTPDKSYDLYMTIWSRLQRFSSTAQYVNVPAGYLHAMAFSLAEILAPEYGAAPDANIAAIAAKGRNALLHINAPRMVSEQNDDMWNAGLYSGRSFDIRNFA